MYARQRYLFQGQYFVSTTRDFQKSAQTNCNYTVLNEATKAKKKPSTKINYHST